MLVICYTQPPQGEKNYDIFENIDEFNKKHPDCTPVYIFNKNDEYNTKQASEFEHFCAYCKLYDFDENDYKQQFKTHNDYNAQLIDFIPRNHKYTCRVFVETENKYYKMTPKYVKQQIEQYKQKNSDYEE